jgi:hypothetical protein
MARKRTPPKCPNCGETIAKAVYKKRESWQQPFVGDSFLKWEYLKHECK